MSAIGPKQTCPRALHMSAFGGKADIQHNLTLPFQSAGVDCYDALS
jgi:hypothetical protein